MSTSAETTALMNALRSAGLRLTPQRLAIVQCIVGDETHPTAQELYERLQRRFPTISVATVYNTLSALNAIGHCRQLDMGGPSRFDPNVAPHDHAVCERCGAIRDVDRQPVQAPALRGGAATRARNAEPGCSLPGFRVAHVERIYRGLCAKCADAA
jgi:Fur family peroxide stress response transcriptional regulator